MLHEVDLQKMHDIKINKILDEIHELGFITIEKFVSHERLKSFMPEVYRRFKRQSFNGTVGYVQFNKQKYLQWTLAVHPEILRLYLDPLIIECCERYIGNPVHLQDYRIYQNQGGLRMRWHVDNKQTLSDGSSQMLPIKGLIALIYLEDVNHGPFEFVAKSHHWAWKENREFWDKYYPDFKKDIVTFNSKPEGTLILYDYRGIHRAQPHNNSQPRTTLFAQYSGSGQPTGEPIILDTSSLDNLSFKEQQILRFGKPASAPTWPIPIDANQSYLGFFSKVIKKTKQYYRKFKMTNLENH